MNSPKFRIAIAEDKISDIEMIKEAFKSLPQYEIVIAAICGKKLIQELDKLKHLPHLVLMDMQMPNCDGLTATIVCKHRYPNLKIVGLSSHTYESVICEFMAEGGDGFLSKFILTPNSIAGKFTYKEVNVFEKALTNLIIDNNIYFDPLCHYQGQDYSSITNTKSIIQKHYSHLTYEQILLLHLNQAAFTQQEIANLLAQSLPTVKRKMGKLFKLFNAENHSDLVNITQMFSITKTVKLYQMYA